MDQGSKSNQPFILLKQVTPPKSAGLNPNANVFQSKGATTPPEPTSTGGSNSSSDWQENTDQLNNVVAPEGLFFCMPMQGSRFE